MGSMKAKNLFGWLPVYAVAYLCWIPALAYGAYKMCGHVVGQLIARARG
jgi:hypothetical protein